MPEQIVVTPEVVTPAAVTPVEKQVAPVEDKSLLGGAKELTPEVGADGKPIVKAEETPEQKVERETKEAADKKVADSKVVPEKYELKMPEGFSVDQASLDALTPTFKELGLTNEGVQKLATVYAPIIKAQAEAQQKAAMDVWSKETDGWKAESIKMLGADAPKELAFAAKVIDKVGTQYKNADGSMGNKLRDILDETRVGNHPEITKLFIEIGKRLSQDSFVEGDKTTTGKGTFVDLYDHPDSKTLTR